MARMRRFEDHRFLGLRDEMVVYDCDDEGQFAVLEERMKDDELVRRTQLSTFAPDSLAEARNRGFSPR